MGNIDDRNGSSIEGSNSERQAVNRLNVKFNNNEDNEEVKSPRQ